MNACAEAVCHVTINTANSNDADEDNDDDERIAKYSKLTGRL